MLSLGHEVSEWITEHLPLPGSPGSPFVLTSEQVRFLLRWYAIDEDGGFVYRRSALVMPKGWGKSPLAAAVALAEFVGPVLFDGLDAKGQPVGRPWGTGGAPPPWIQVAAVSEDQASSNVYSLLWEALASNGGKAAADLGIDEGRTRLFLKSSPGAKLEAVSSSSGSREGQRVTFGVLDETHLWVPGNGGVRLARTIRRNAAKVGGRTVECANAYELGEGSVAEQTHAEAGAGEAGILYVANTPRTVVGPEQDDATLLAALDEAYAEARWVDRFRILAEVRDPGVPWADAVRYFLNLPSPGGSAAVDPRQWDTLGLEFDVPGGATLWAGFSSHETTALVGCVQGPDGRPHLIPLDVWEPPRGAEPGWRVPRHQVHAAVDKMFEDYDVVIAYCDPSTWRSELEDWADQYGEKRIAEFPTNSRIRMGPAVERFVVAIAEGQLSHADHPDLTRHVVNAVLRTSGGNNVLAKAGPTRYIDACVAAVLALQAQAAQPREDVEYLMMLD